MMAMGAKGDDVLPFLWVHSKDGEDFEDSSCEDVFTSNSSEAYR